jgi:hypothetical protein
MVTTPWASQYTGPLSVLLVNLTVTPLAMLIVVKLKTFGMVGWSPSATGSKLIVPAVVKFKGPSAPVEPLLNAWP